METAVETRVCLKCGKEKHISEFGLFWGKQRKRRYHRRSCKCCANKVIRQKNCEKYKENARNYQLMRNYGISRVEYDEMVFDQNYKCAICQKPETVTYKGKIAALSVDHNHVSGKRRALLCRRCNWLLGAAKESVGTINAAIKYLEKHGRERYASY